MDTSRCLPLSALPVWKQIPAQVELLYREALVAFKRKLIVLDDDPTGIQTVHGVSVYTDWSYESILDCFQEESMSFILTNSRSFTATYTKEVHCEIAGTIARVSRETGRDFVLISRGDSTMRGHWPLETQTLADTFVLESGTIFDGEIIMPFFMEGGRFTFGNVHYVRDGETLIPAGESEFAQDATFGYTSSDLTEWCAEKTNGAYPAARCICIALEDIRALRVDKITQQLMEARDFAKIVVNAVCYEDLKVFCAAYVRALVGGKSFLARTAAAWTKVLGGIPDRPLLSHGELVQQSDTGGIILVGSHVNKTTLQLDHLRTSGLAIRFVEFDATRVLEPQGLKQETARVIALVEDLIRQGSTVAVYTTRRRIDPEGMDREQRLQLSVAISDAVTGVIEGLHVRPSFIVTKGGITSSDVGVKALRVKKARVMGQVLPGVPVWLTGAESRLPGMPYIIFPGNVGDETALTQVATLLMEQ